MRQDESTVVQILTRLSVLATNTAAQQVLVWGCQSLSFWMARYCMIEGQAHVDGLSLPDESSQRLLARNAAACRPHRKMRCVHL